MKMVNSLLLGSAAGPVAVAGAQAADLPVKAKPVEYVKICSLYGEGFFYIPGTDTCIKIGGWVRMEAIYNGGGSFSEYLGGPGSPGGGGPTNSKSTSDYRERARTVMSFDVRTQTEYGTLRSYYRGGFELTTDALGGGQGTYYYERAFIQFAGFTVGKSQSYFDFYAGVFGYGITYSGGGGSNTLGGGTLLWAYTAQFGTGFSATISAEDNEIRRNAVWDAGTNAMGIGVFPGPGGTGVVGYATCGVNTYTGDAALVSGIPSVTGCTWGDYAGNQIPDIVGNLRVDQAWGSAQIAGALHQVRTLYYGNDVTNTLTAVGPSAYTGIAPGDKWGWAAMGGVVLNLPWSAGDKFWVEGTYTQGAVAYTGLSQSGLNGNMYRFSGNTAGAGWGLDGVFANMIGAATPVTAGTVGAPSGIQLTTAWTVGAAIEHYWTPSVRTSLFGQYEKVTYNGVATTIFCGSGTLGPVRTLAGTAGSFAAPLPGCNPDFATYGIGLRTIWNPVKNLDVGLEVMYSKLDQNMDPTLTRLNFAGSGARPNGLYVPADQDVWSGGIRIQRNFWP